MIKIILWLPFKKSITMVTMSTFVSVSISKNVSFLIVYMFAKFGAFIKKCTMFLVSRYTIIKKLHFYQFFMGTS